MTDAVEVIRDWLVDGGFDVGYKIQADEWRDSENKADKFIVTFGNAI